MRIEKYTIGMGDRFAHEGQAQLQAVLDAWAAGIKVFPVWNKSNREHTLVKSHPNDLRVEADRATQNLGWTRPYYVDADHIALKTVDAFLDSCNFYTIDVAEYRGMPAEAAAIEHFVHALDKYSGPLLIPGIPAPLQITHEVVYGTARKFLLAIREAGNIYRHIEHIKGRGRFVTEISIDETDSPQTPAELFLILAMIGLERIPAQTIAPRFTGRFNKGVDYSGEISKFAREFDENLSVIAFAIREFSLPDTLKLSVHSGSDKFSIYPDINRLIKKHHAGLHVKTAGTTWLEEVIGLAESGGEGLAIAKDIYTGACARFGELTGPYASVVDIEKGRLPSPGDVAGWDSCKFANTLRHVPSCPDYNSDFRQLLHVAFKVAAEMEGRFTGALIANREHIARNVTANLFQRHIKPIFG